MRVTMQTAGPQTPSTSSQPGTDDRVHGLLCDRIRQLEAEGSGGPTGWVAEPPIIVYNVIELIVKNGMEQHPEVTPAVVSDAFSIDCKKTNTLIQLVQSYDKHDKEGVVKVGGQKTEVFFEPDEIQKWPEGLTVPETVICLSKGNWSKVAIPVTNDRNYNITLTPRTILGHVQQVKSIYQADPQAAERQPEQDDGGEQLDREDDIKWSPRWRTVEMQRLSRLSLLMKQTR
ncbi:hypothetical protein D4764_18G0009160 [Takifugu flavidus]|uniref:Uncharacterized protein n=1 Tax=Takifugu flavidus TaxID=433684 RepID=A0A5C6NVG7_9TELE|nr:hypothetical protein D4764_18G0009160 [Takifugu flavidus]